MVKNSKKLIKIICGQQLFLTNEIKIYKIFFKDKSNIFKRKQFFSKIFELTYNFAYNKINKFQNILKIKFFPVKKNTIKPADSPNYTLFSILCSSFRCRLYYAFRTPLSNICLSNICTSTLWFQHACAHKLAIF